MEAIILAGGLGTRLRLLLTNLPKGDGTDCRTTVS